MSLAYGDLERMLLNEQKKCDDHLVIGGLEQFITKWAAQQKTDGDSERVRRADQVMGALVGYGAADPVARKPMIDQALAVLRTEPPEEVAIVPETMPTPPEPPPDEFEDEDETPAAASTLRQSQGGLSLSTPPRANLPQGLGLDASVARLQNVGPAHAKKLQKLGAHTVEDLLYLFPRRYDDYSKLKTISQLLYGEEVTLLLTVGETRTRETHRGLTVTNVLLADPTGTIQATFFNQPYLQQQFKSGRRIVISGRVDQDLGRLAFKSPEWEPLSKELLHTARIVPVYPLTEGLTNRWLRRLINGVVEFWAPKVQDPLPEFIRERAKLVDLTTALREVHFPTSFEKMEAARRRLALEEFLYIQIGVLRQRRKWREVPGRALNVDSHLISSFVAALPFQLTGAQKRALDEILGDIQRSQPMSRLLQGDVGSGKTVVAAAAMLAAVANGAQAALMAPTEILAEQHYQTLKTILEYQPNPPRVARLIGSMKNREKEEARAKIAAGEIDIAVGTHALIQEDVQFKSLALAVIDEQHRFGVEQRATIRAKGYNPHILVMSATPIPRTLALTVYGDLDLSIIDEMPPGRQEIKTKWLEPRERERAYAFIRNQVKEGRQAFVICPLIEESESIDAKAAVDEFERLNKQVYPDLHVGLIHGKLRASEKDETMNGFRDHQIDILVATSVVEVGIDVPNATVMLIEGADRFGLAQLHQFRGRVGRGEHQSYCLLLVEKSGATSDERLRVIESTQDGFRLAEEDLKLRGPGEFFGTRQSGLPDLKIAKLSDVKILEEARSIAQDLFERDPGLVKPEHKLLSERVSEFWKGKGDLS
ncbi:MAG: ATP-dependent DNA helicase RecG [Chloroflexota bacterium]|nr:ATP-dependent DNA helicase RecG [Chloroflexota bacterium]